MRIFKPVIATFNGRHNRCKSLALLTLLDQKQKGESGLTLKELARLSGVSYDYLNSRLGKWHEWKYVTRRIISAKNGPCYSYSIAKRGEEFIEYRIPPHKLTAYLAHLREHRQRLNAEQRERAKQALAAFHARLARLRAAGVIKY